jgi:hypothetical protein
MKIFLSALEQSLRFQYIDQRIDAYYFNLLSYYYLKVDIMKRIVDKSQEVLIDSGAHTFQKGKKVDWESYTNRYANFIKNNDHEKILGYFEMDIDPAGYSLNYVNRLKIILQSKSKKIIQVWHKNRGIKDFIEMCKNPIHEKNVVSISGFKNQDIKDKDFIKFVNYAHYCGCKIHGLGITRKDILSSVPFDYVDSSSWVQRGIFGRGYNHAETLKFNRNYTSKTNNHLHLMYNNYLEGMKLQKEYLMK